MLILMLRWKIVFGEKRISPINEEAQIMRTHSQLALSMAIIFLIILPCYAVAEDSEISTNYIVFDVSHFGAVRYQWFVLDHEGHVLDDDYFAQYPPEAEMIDKNILMLKMGAGTASFISFMTL